MAITFVVQDIQPQHRQAAIHEYSHFVFRSAGLKLPLWLCEGTADFYSPLLIDGDKEAVGGMLSARIGSLKGDSLIPLRTLVAVDGASSFYNDERKVGLFYAQSWALVHMLAFNEPYRKHLGDFIAAVSGGLPTEEALHQTYKGTIDEVMTDFRRYIPTMAGNESVTRFQATERYEPTVTHLSEINAALTLADLLAAHRTTAPRAKRELVTFTEHNPGNRQAEELLAYLATQEPTASPKLQQEQ